MTGFAVSSEPRPRALRECVRSWGALLSVLVGVTAVAPAPRAEPPTLSPADAPVEARVADLLARMTLEEKVAQLQGIWNRKREIQDADGRFDPTKAQALLGFGIGEVSRPSEIAGPPSGLAPGARHASRRVFVNAVQRWLIENTRLGIPAMFHEEALHGLTAPGGTHFPVPIGLASTWDPALVERLMSVAALEGARARHAARPLARRRSRTRSALGAHRGDLRRGSVSRVAMGVAAVRGYQGTRAAARRRQGLRDLEALRRTRLARRRHQHGAAARPGAAAARRAARAVRGGGEGGRLHRDAELQRGGRRAVARQPTGCSPTSCGVSGDSPAWSCPTTSASSSCRRATVWRIDKADAGAQALEAGVDLELPDPYGFPELVGAGQERPDRGIADRPVGRRACCARSSSPGCSSIRTPTPIAPSASTNTAEHQALALEAARKSIVLLKNQGGAAAARSRAR